MTTPNRYTKIDREFDEKAQDLIDWNYGTIHKQYDRDETCECLEEDTRKYLSEIKEYLHHALDQARQEAREEVIKAISLQPDLAENDKEMADDLCDPKVRINYFRYILDQLSIKNKEHAK